MSLKIVAVQNISHLYFKMSSIKSLYKYFMWVSCETKDGYLESYDGGSVML